MLRSGPAWFVFSRFETNLKKIVFNLFIFILDLLNLKANLLLGFGKVFCCVLHLLSFFFFAILCGLVPLHAVKPSDPPATRRDPKRTTRCPAAVGGGPGGL